MVCANPIVATDAAYLSGYALYGTDAIRIRSSGDTEIPYGTGSLEPVPALMVRGRKALQPSPGAVAQLAVKRDASDAIIVEGRDYGPDLLS